MAFSAPRCALLYRACARTVCGDKRYRYWVPDYMVYSGDITCINMITIFSSCLLGRRVHHASPLGCLPRLYRLSL